MSIICPGPTLSGLALEASATGGDRTAVMNTFTRVDTTAGDVFITLPASGSSGDRVAIAAETGGNVVFVNPDTGDTLDGAVDGTERVRDGEVVTWIWDGTSAWVRESRSSRGLLNFSTATGTWIEATANRLDFYRNDASNFGLTSSGIEFGALVIPDLTDIRDIGTALLLWRDIFVRGGIVAGSRGSAPSPASGQAYVYANDNAGTLEYRAAFNGSDYLLVDENGSSDLGPAGTSGFSVVDDSAAGSPSMPTDGTAFKLATSSGNIPYDSVTGRWTLSANTTYCLQAEIRAVGISGDVAKYRFYNVTDSAYIGVQGFNQEVDRSSVNACNSQIAVAQIKPTATTVVELRNTSGTSTGTYTGSFSKAWIFSVGGADGADAISSIEVAVGSAPGGAYATSGVEYLPLRVGQADTIEFQFVAAGDCAIDIVYAMSASNAGDVDLRLDSLVLTDGGDPDAALSTGTVTTFVPGADVNRHTAASANFEITAAAGDVVRALLERPATDTHTGDMRVLDLRVRAL